MVEVIWTEPALNDLDAIADYIALQDAAAARNFVQAVFRHVDHLRQHPRLGSYPAELTNKRYRQIVEPPCRIFYRQDRPRVFIVHVMRSERLLRRASLTQR
jgi:plasmid stabilization system protein ParE